MKPLKCLFRKHIWIEYTKYGGTWRQCADCPRLEVKIKQHGQAKWVTVEEFERMWMKQINKWMSFMEKAFKWAMKMHPVAKNTKGR